MAKRDRATLKRFFQSGAIPDARHFEDLIDSTGNLVEDMHDRILNHGKKIVADTEAKLLQFYSDKNKDKPQWSIALDKLTNHLHIQPECHDNETALPSLSVADTGMVGINTAAPEASLHVGGMIKAKGRIGDQMLDPSVVALSDGEWHAITSVLTGCNALEVTAATLDIESGESVIIHGTAVNTQQPKVSEKKWSILKSKNDTSYTEDGISINQSTECKSGLGIDLRWNINESGSYVLEIRTNKSLGKSTKICYQIQILWQDHELSNCKLIG